LGAAVWADYLLGIWGNGQHDKGRLDSLDSPIEHKHGVSFFGFGCVSWIFFWLEDDEGALFFSSSLSSSSTSSTFF